MIPEKEWTFKTLDSGDKVLDTIFFVKQLFEQQFLTGAERVKVLGYFMLDSASEFEPVKTRWQQRMEEMQKQQDEIKAKQNVETTN